MRKKRQHFADLTEWSHVHEPVDFNDPLSRGQWGPKVLLELACGKGIYTVALAERYPDALVLGMDIKGARLWHGAKEVLDQGLSNAAFIRGRIEDLPRFFAPDEVDEIWITFPDPHPRKGKIKKRLTSPRFLDLYRQVLKSDGRVVLKTDSKLLFDYTRELLMVRKDVELDFIVEDVYGEEDVWELLTAVQTDYEKRFLREGRQIYALAFRFTAS